MRAVDFVQRNERSFRYLWIFLYWQLALLVVILIIERLKKRHQAGDQSRQEQARLPMSWVTHVRPAHYLLVILSVFVGASTFTMVKLYGRLHDDYQQSLASSLDLKSQLSLARELAKQTGRFGYPPVPMRPPHETRIRGTYYRGNCERHARVFNGGNYRTASLHIDLCDSERQPINVGDSVPAGSMYVRFEIERAPNAAKQLFGKGMLNSVFLSEEVYPFEWETLKDEPVFLETLEEGERWVAYYPIGPMDGSGNGRLKGVVYLYKGKIEEKKVRGSCHYAIKYNLEFQDGSLQPESELWMGYLFASEVIAEPEVGKIPSQEWFDHEPIPVITGKNTTDPKLLGLEQHLGKESKEPGSETGSETEEGDNQIER